MTPTRGTTSPLILGSALHTAGNFRTFDFHVFNLSLTFVF